MTVSREQQPSASVARPSGLGSGSPLERQVARRRPNRNSYDTPPRRVRRTAALAACIVLLPSLIGYVSSMLGRSDSSLGIRTVEWLTDNGARGLVDQVENIYYSLTAPSKGGPGIKRLPKQVGVAVATAIGPASHRSRHRHRPHYEPPPIAPILHPALAGEGVWRAPYTAGHDAHPPVLVTSFRPNPAYPSFVAGVAWIDHTETSIRLYPGIQEPSVFIPERGPEEVPTTLRSQLLATFNSGFKLQDSGGGFSLDGHTYAAMHDGLATIVGYTNGRVNVVSWTGGPTVKRNVLFARQNLPLLVSHGKVNPDINNGADWGATLGNAVMVWRSSIGIDRHGNLIYAAANDQTAASLAQIQIHAGAVRAMELDINAYWPSFITYTGPNGVGAANLLPSMNRSPLRYLTPDDRDFFAVYTRRVH